MKYRWFDTSELCNTFNVDGACSALVDVSPIRQNQRQFGSGMKGRKHSEETKRKMSIAATGQRYPSVFVGGKIMKDGVIVEFDCIAEICRELNLSTGHLSEVLKGKRRSVKGWVKV